jgi:4-carboxymuconolactone decarboxylase
MTSRQHEVFDRIAGSRGSVEGPFAALLHAPELADRVQSLGAYLRFETELERDLAEAAVLVTARAHGCSYEWETHEPHARAAGVPDGVIEVLRSSGDATMLPPRYRPVAEYAQALAASGRVSEEVYRRTASQMGTRRILELTTLVGYYTMLAMTLNAFDIAGEPDAVEGATLSGTG